MEGIREKKGFPEVQQRSWETNPDTWSLPNWGGEGEQHQREGWGRGPGGVDDGKYHWFEPHRSGEG